MPIKKEKLNSIKGYSTYKKQSETTGSSASGTASSQKAATLKKDKREQLYSSSASQNTKATQSTTGSSGVGRKQVLEGHHASGTADSGDYSALLKLAETSVSNAQKKRASATQAASAAQRGYATAQQKSTASNALSSAKQKTAEAEAYRNEVQHLYDSAKRAEEKTSKYDTLSRNADYAEKSQYRSTKKTDGMADLAGHFQSSFMGGSDYNNIGYNDIEYDAINRDAEALSYAKKAKGYETDTEAAAAHKTQLDAAKASLDAAKAERREAQKALESAESSPISEEELEKLKAALRDAENAVTVAQSEYDGIGEKYLTASGADDMASRYLRDADSISQMTDEEIANFNYLYALDEEKGDKSHTSAYEYLEWLRQDLNARQRQENTTAATAYAEVHPVGSSAASVAMSVPKGISYVGQTLDYLDDGKIDQNASYNRFSYMPTAIRSKVSETVENKWGGVGTFLYQTGMSMGDFVATAVAGGLTGGATTIGAEALTLSIMGSGAAADTVIEAKDNGLSDQRAFIRGTIAGAAEIVTEKMGWDALFDTALRGKSPFTYLVKNILSEGFEEGSSDVINWIADDLYDCITGESNSEWKQQIAAYMASGYSESQATALALANRFGELGLDMLGGALSGGIMAGVSIGGNAAINNYLADVNGAVINLSNEAQEVVAKGLQMPEGSKARTLAETIQTKLQAGDTVEDSEIGRLSMETNTALAEQAEEQRRTDLQTKLTAQGATEEQATRVTDTIVSVLGGKEISGRDANRILRTPGAVAVLQEETGVSINTDAPLGEVKAQIRSIAALAKAQNAVADVDANAEINAEATENAQDAISAQANERIPLEEQAVSEPVQPDLRATDNQETTTADNGVRLTVPETRSAETVRADRSYMRRAASIFGENGSKALTAAYDNAVAADYSADEIIKGFSKVYNAVLNGKEVPDVSIPESVKAAARGAAQLDRQRAKSAARSEESGLVRDETFRKAHMNSTQAKLLDRVAKALGVQIKVAENVFDENGTEVNGSYQNGEITLSLKGNDPMLTTAIHEAIHRIREASPEAYEGLASFVMDALGDRNFSTILGFYSDEYDGSTDFVSEEVVADAMGRVLSDETALQKFTELHRDLAQTLRDVLADLVNTIKRAIHGQNKELTAAQRSNMRQVYAKLEEAVELFDKALESVAEEQKGLQSSDGDAKIEKARYSRRSELYHDRRQESQDDFRRRCLEKGYTIHEGKKTVYGCRHIEGRYIKESAGLAREELEKLGIKSLIIDGDVAYNKRGITVEEGVTEAAAAENDFVFINNGIDVPAKECAGHEGFHFWRNTPARENYIDVLADNIKLRSTAFLNYQSEIAQDYLGAEADLNNDAQVELLSEEIYAYISGDIHEGTHDEFLSTILRNVDAVRAAWNELVEVNKGGQSKVRYSRKTNAEGSTDLFWQKRQDGWDKTYGTAQEAFNAALAANDAQLYERFIATVYETSYDSGHSPTVEEDRLTTAMIDAAEFVRHYDVSPAAAATFISNAYHDGTIETYTDKRGHLYDSVSELMKKIDADHATNSEQKNPAGRPEKKTSKDLDEQIANALQLRNALEKKMEEYSAVLAEKNRQISALERQNQTLTKSRDKWKHETKRTTPEERHHIKPGTIEKAAKKLLGLYGVNQKMELAGALEKLTTLYEGIATGEYRNSEEPLRIAREIANLVMDKGTQANAFAETNGDILSYLKGKKVEVSAQDAHDIADYNAFRQKNRWRLRLAKPHSGGIPLDVLYMELEDMWPGLFSSEEQSTVSDMLIHLDEVLDDVEEQKRTPISEGLSAEQYDAAIDEITDEVLFTFYDLPQVKKTFADKQYEKWAKERGRWAVKLENEKAKGKANAETAKEKFEAERAAADNRIQQLRKENAENVKKRLEEVRKGRDEKLQALKDKYKAKTAAGRERQNAKEIRNKIVRHAKALSEKLLTPSDKKHIPQELRGAVATLLASLNQESGYTIDENGKRVKRYTLDKGGNRVQNEEHALTKRSEAFRQLKEEYEKLEKSNDNSEIVVDSDLVDMLDEVAKFRDIPMDSLTSEELGKIWNVVKAVEHSVMTAGKVLSKAKFENTKAWADAFRRDTFSKRNRKSTGMRLSLENPYTFFAHFGAAGKAAYRMLRDAQDHEQVMTNQIAEKSHEIASPETVKANESTAHTFHVGEYGETLVLTTAQVMDIYNLSKREAARNHLLIGGVVQPELKGEYTLNGEKKKLEIEYGGASDSAGIQLTEEDLTNFANFLTDEQKKIADKLQELTVTTLSEWGNEASMRAYGYKKFTGKDYWPIKSAKGGIKTTVEAGGEGQRSIKNIGMAKQLTPNANNAVDLNSVYRTFSNHVSDMTTYAAWLCPMEDMNHLYNFRFTNEKGEDLGNMKGLLDSVAGKGAKEYWTKLEGDIQNGINTKDFEPLTAFVSGGIGAFKGAAVGANLRVVIQQPTAFFRAGLVLDAKNMAKGVAKGATKGSGWQKAVQYSPIAMRKESGGFDIASQSKMINTLFDQRSKIRKVNDALSIGAEKADAVTWGKLWNACEWQTKEQHSELTVGSKAFYEETAKLFAEVVDQTQVVDGVLQRTNIMRAKSEIAKQATSFMGEPLMSLNIMLRAYDSVRYEQDPATRSKAIKLMGRAATALVVTNVVNALAQSVVDAWRDDDKDKKYWERFWAAFTGVDGSEGSLWDKATNAMLEGNLGSNMNVIGQIPYAKDVLSLLQGYSVSRTEMEVVEDFINAAEQSAKALSGSSQKTTAYTVKNLAAMAAKFFGLPVSNITRDMWGIARSIAVETDSIPVMYEMEKAIYSISKVSNKSRFLDLLYKAIEQGDMESYERIRDDLMNKMGVDGKSIESGLQSRYNKAKAADPEYSMPQSKRSLFGSYDKNEAAETEESFSAKSLDAEHYKAYSEQRAAAWESVADDLAANGTFQSMSEYEQTEVLEDAYKFAEQMALQDNSEGQYTISTKWMANYPQAEKAGIGTGSYVLYHAMYNSTESLKDKSGKTISNSKGLQFMEAVYESGVSYKQAQALFECYDIGTSIRDLTANEVREELRKCYAKQ